MKTFTHRPDADAPQAERPNACGFSDATQPGAVVADPTDSAADLSPSQRTVIQLMTAGQTAQSAATAAGVNRTTVYRWMKSDPAFQADAVATARARLVAATDVAVSAVVAAMTKGDAKTALAVLGRLDLLQPPVPGPTDPAVVAREQAVAERKAYAKVLLDEDAAFMG